MNCLALRCSCCLVFFLQLAQLSAADLSVPTPFPTIQDAIDASMDGDRILIAPGTYVENLSIVDRSLELLSTGGLVTINGGGEGTVVASLSSGMALTIDGITVTNQPPSPGQDPFWIGIELFGEGSLVLRNSVLTACSTGGIVQGGTGHVVENCTISDNERTGLSFREMTGTVSVRDSLFTRNFGVTTGALALESTFGPATGTAIVEGCEFTENESLFTAAGALVSRLEQAEFSQCLFTDNVSSYGGTLTVGPVEMFHATTCRLIGNEAGQGGGILVDLGAVTNQVTFDRCLLVDNEVARYGGAISASANEGTIFVHRCTMANNSAPTEGAVSAQGHTVAVENSIAWGNGLSSALRATTGAVSISYSSVEGGYPGVGNIDLDPQFTDPASGFQYSLLPGSPCIDAGDPAHPLDLDGSIVDMGAIPFETVSSSSPLSMAPIFLRGDANGDGLVNIADPVKLIEHLFSGGFLGCHDRSDVNDDGQLDGADPVRLLTYLFASGEPPAPPFPNCWWDGTVDGLGCEDLPACE